MNAGLFVGILFLGTLIEWLVERFFGGWITGKPMYFISAGIGILLTCLLQIQILQATGLLTDGVLTSTAGIWTDRVLSGIIVGSGSSFIHTVWKLVDDLRSRTK